jgi:hypothetical protein
MTTPSGIFWSRDVYRATFFPIRTDGGINAPGYPVPAATPYEGLELVGPKNFSFNLGAARAVTNVSQGRVNDTMYLPSIDAKTAEFHLSYFDQAKFATLSGVKRRTIGAGTGMPLATDKQGLEISGTFVISHLKTQDDDGVQQWHNYLIPRCRAVVGVPNADDNDFDITVQMSLSSTMKHIWGEALTELADGATKMHAWDHVTWDRLNLVAWLADGSEDTFLLPTDKPAASTYATSFTVWDYALGTEVSGTPSTASFVAGSAPTADKLLIAVYEY